MRRPGVNQPLTVEALSQDCLDVHDLRKMGALKGEWTTFRPLRSLRWPAIRKIRAARYLVQIDCTIRHSRSKSGFHGPRVLWAAGVPGCIAHIAKSGWQSS
jgi:hypothetical protein